MPLPIAMGVAAISRFILTKGMQKAIKKFGREAVNRTTKSKTYAKMKKNPPMTTGQKVIAGGSAATGAVGTAGIGAGFYTVKQSSEFRKLQDKRKEAKDKSKKDIKVELLEDKQTKTSNKKKKREFDTYTRD
tara:strand:+ start:87 stop:482 length:396 start_codon:yes stop_codon:yes gene_type:complete